MSALEWIGVGIGLLYLYLEYQANIWLWLAGIVMPAIYIVVYYNAGFYADMGINIYYLLAGIYGWLKWCGEKKDESADALPITRMPRRKIFNSLIVCAAFFVVISYILISFTDSTIPYSDSFTTALSIVALWMLAKKYVEQWLAWCVVDVACVVLYIYKGLYPTAGLYALYSIIAVAGYYKWLKLMNNEKNQIATH